MCISWQYIFSTVSRYNFATRLKLTFVEKEYFIAMSSGKPLKILGNITFKYTFDYIFLSISTRRTPSKVNIIFIHVVADMLVHVTGNI